MTKKLCLQYIDIVMCILSDEDIAYPSAKSIINKFVNNDFSLKDSLDSTNSNLANIVQIHKMLLSELNKLSMKEKDIIINSLTKLIYSISYYNKIAYNINNTYKDREVARYKLLINELTVYIIKSFIGENKDLKSDFLKLKKALSDYNVMNISIIADLADNKQDGLKAAIEERNNDAHIILSKYKSTFNLTNISLISMVEYDMLYRNSTKNYHKYHECNMVC